MYLQRDHVVWPTLVLSLLVPAFSVAYFGIWSDPERVPLRLQSGVVAAYTLPCTLILLAFWSQAWRWLQQSPQVPPERLRCRIRGVLLALVAMMFAYVIGLAALYIVLTGLGATLNWWSVQGVVLALAVMAAAVLVALPAILVVVVRLGSNLGAHLDGREVLPIAVRHIPVSALMLILLCSIPGVAYLVFGTVPPEVWWIWGLLAVYGVGIVALSLWFSHVGLHPILRFLASERDPAEWQAEQLVPRALDGVGSLTYQLQKMVRRIQQLTQQHEQSETRLRMFAEASSDWFFETDESLRFTWVSPVLESLAGVDTSTVVGRSAVALNHSNYLSRAAADAHLEDLRARRPYRRFRTEVQTEDGRHIHIEVSGTPCFDDEGRFRGYRGTGSNITEMVESQQRLMQRDAELAQAQKMEAVGQLTGGIAHDFNNLLTVVIGNLELIRMSQTVDADLAELLGEACTAADRGADLVRRLLAFARKQPLQPRAVELPALLNETEQLVRRALGEAIELHVELPSVLWPVLVDENQLQNSLLNLALNAREAMPTGGSLSITATNQVRDTDGVELPAGNYVEIRVRDDGFGIREADLSRVFEPFFSTRADSGGSGLGLSMIHGFVKQSGGTVTIDSQWGAGTVVGLWLPRASQSAPTDDADAASP